MSDPVSSQRWTDLEQELGDIRDAMTSADHGLLRQFGVSEMMWSLGLASVARVAFEGECWWPDSHGEQAILTPVRLPLRPGLEALYPMSWVTGGTLLDVAATMPDTSEHSYLRKGLGSVLGVIEPQLVNPEPVRVWRSPISWLRAGGKGIVLLTDSLDIAFDILVQIRTPVAEDLEHWRKLRAAFERPFRAPTILVPSKAASQFHDG